MDSQSCMNAQRRWAGNVCLPPGVGTRLPTSLNAHVLTASSGTQQRCYIRTRRVQVAKPRRPASAGWRRLLRVVVSSSRACSRDCRHATGCAVQTDTNGWRRDAKSAGEAGVGVVLQMQPRSGIFGKMVWSGCGRSPMKSAGDACRPPTPGRRQPMNWNARRAIAGIPLAHTSCVATGARAVRPGNAASAVADLMVCSGCVTQRQHMAERV